MSGAAVSSLPAVGKPAPDFTLPSMSGADVTLSSLRGKNVLLAFFPLAFTSVCTQEMCALTEDYGRFRDANTEVLPISVEEKFFSNRAYVLVGPDGLVRWAYAEDTTSTRRGNDELLAQLETRQRSA